MKSPHAFTLIAIVFACHQGLADAADTYPSRPVRLIVPYAAGGGSDINPTSVDEFRALIESELRRWKEVVAQTYIRLEQ